MHWGSLILVPWAEALWTEQPVPPALLALLGKLAMNRLEASWLAAVRPGGDGVRDGRVLVACSGGGDSVALLAFLWAVRRSLGLELVVAHAHHGLRPEADAGGRPGARPVPVRGPGPGGGEPGRAGPRPGRGPGPGDRGPGAALDLAAQPWPRAEGAAAVATGHTLDDHTETVLVRLARGGGAGCLTPLPRRQGLRWSPLVQARREDLRAYLRQKGIPWLEDASNQEPVHPPQPLAPAAGAHARRSPGPGRAPLGDPPPGGGAGRLPRPAGGRLARRALGAGRTRAGPAAGPAPGPSRSCAGPWRRPPGQCGWPREPDLLRDLAAWMLPHLQRKPGKAKEWGGWRLEPSGEKTGRPAHGLFRPGATIALGPAGNRIMSKPDPPKLRTPSPGPVRLDGARGHPPWRHLEFDDEERAGLDRDHRAGPIGAQADTPELQSQRDRLLHLLHRGRRRQIPQRHPDRPGCGGDLQERPSRAPRAR